jgi:nicotinamidase-related amidase
LVESLQVGEYVVFGVCTEYCVATAVEGLLARGAKVAIVTDAIRPLDEAKGAQVLKRFADRGVRFVHTAEVVHSAEEEPVSTGTGDDVDDAL